VATVLRDGESDRSKLLVCVSSLVGSGAQVVNRLDVPSLLNRAVANCELAEWRRQPPADNCAAVAGADCRPAGGKSHQPAILPEEPQEGSVTTAGFLPA
jgi:hypothetical protein